MADELKVEARMEDVERVLRAKLTPQQMNCLSLSEVTGSDDPFDSTSRGEGLDHATIVQFVVEAIAGGVLYDLVKITLQASFDKVVEGLKDNPDDHSGPESK